ncbi:hypothetical protein ANCCEY_13714 [Ancylostoma ceylanicum]|uniref:Chondroitin proteoglycan 3 n=2 Tax=Ancylostoma ceylanicum TaxID=53326 RepID=A0A0D6L6W4_9BILA|nr:hypothetical protein ANCCEY_13714 [Ancylostoma ceylanicum]EYC22763.1 hypothetical protein Y032_0016g2931 [Ancylostoma ceylanicum]
MQVLPLVALTLTTAFCHPLFDTDPVLVVTGELTEEEVTRLEASGAVMVEEEPTVEATTSIRHKREDIEASGLERSADEDEDIIEETTIETTTVANKTCKAFDVCFGDQDCPGGQCLGAFVGKCNCNACLDFWLCESDAACGGLKGACNKITKTCDCQAGFKAAGFPLFVDALRGLCNQKSCNKDNAADECFGLPCHFGRCNC